ncbi:MAG: hypothetical protein LBC81_00045 [Tannerellaceae bacterium]|jgi:hypothetical protein|nr:hypothetical protein [Tannerellaceae bacterium]
MKIKIDFLTAFFALTFSISAQVFDDSFMKSFEWDPQDSFEAEKLKVYNNAMGAVLKSAYDVVNLIPNIGNLRNKSPKLYQGVVYCMAQFLAVEQLYFRRLVSGALVAKTTKAKGKFMESLRTPQGAEELNIIRLSAWVRKYSLSKAVILQDIERNNYSVSSQNRTFGFGHISHQINSIQLRYTLKSGSSVFDYDDSSQCEHLQKSKRNRISLLTLLSGQISKGLHTGYWGNDHIDLQT